MLRWRLLLGTLLIAAVAGLCWLDARSAVPGLWLTPLLVVVTLLATQEVLWLLRARGSHPPAWTVYAGNLLVVLGSWLLLVFAGPFSRVADPSLLLLTIAVLMVLLGEMARGRRPNGNSLLPFWGRRQGVTEAVSHSAGNHGAIANCAGGVFALVYVGLMLAFAAQVRFSFHLGVLATWIITAKMGDIGAYTVGRLVGRHKLAPTISPGKTIEGAFGAVLFACLGSWASFTWLLPVLSPDQTAGLTWGWWLVFGFLMALAGMAGDLFESLLKRDAGCKDSSPWLPGFGGVLDIIDSLLLSAPVAWLFWAVGLQFFW